MDLAIDTPDIGLVVTTEGGCVWRFIARRDGGEVPLFRDPPADAGRAALRSGCFPLVPFGNRVRGNRFSFEGADHALTPNMRWDRHYLHGDGWTSAWTVAAHEKNTVHLRLDHRDPATTPYAYEAEQTFVVSGPTLSVTLAVTNRGAAALPFGLGWHPYFPLTPGTTLRASTRSYWDEDASWLPTNEHRIAGDLDFTQAAPLPRRWVNTAFEGWDGQAVVTWPEHDTALAIEADPLFDRCLVFVSDPAFDSGYAYDFFCFEPMSHSVDGHHRIEASGLRRLEPGQRLAGSIRFTVRPATSGKETR
jgi:aldose 1-epimerase